jgi:predicted RNA binding protein YcfA (HicA-like mRNA interferase family)
MPRIPRDVSGAQLTQLLGEFGYRVVRQHGSHIRLEADHPSGRHRLTVPSHTHIKIGTLNGILSDLARAVEVDKAELIRRLFGS